MSRYSTWDIDQPVFPIPNASEWQHYGIMMRDYFAAKAMQGFMNEAEDMHRLSSEQRKELWRIVTGYAYEIADAMLKARES